MSLKDFQMIQQLGQGAYSVVYRVKRLIDNQQYAMKKVKMDNLSEKQKQNALHEVRVLASINHPNIIAYKQAFIEKGSNFLYIIMEYADDGDLLQRIKKHTKNHTTFSQSQIWSIFIQVTQGLKVLHDMRILHRDIKSANVFLNKNGLVKLGDLNVSKLVKSLCQTQTGTPYYASPQIWKDQPYDKKSDIWSLGCVFYEMIALKPPFRANDMQGLYRKVVRGFYSRLPQQYSSDLNMIIKMLLQVPPHLRASCDKILQHPIVLKHMAQLPQSFLNSKIVKPELLKTILIDRRENTDDLAKKVQLPKSRYFSTIDVYKVTESPKKQSVILPRINSKNYQDLQSKSIQNWQKRQYLHKQQHQSRKNSIDKFLSGSVDRADRLERVERKDRGDRKDRKIESHNPTTIQHSGISKRYEGRIKQLSSDIIQKILKKQRQRQKIHSIIGTK